MHVVKVTSIIFKNVFFVSEKKGTQYDMTYCELPKALTRQSFQS